MVWSTPLALATAALQFGQLATASGATWPSSYDELEDIMVLNQGYKARQLSLPVTPCSFSRVPGFLPSAGFLRTAFHDVAPHNAFTGQGGLDASIAFELTGQAGLDNAGPFANNTLTFLSRFYSDQAPMSDLLALATYTAVRSCGGPIIPIRTGRVDATEAGPLGVPKVDATQQGFRDTFSRMGFSTEDMIKLVACGHTLGGVHPPQFPQIVGNLSNGAPVVNFDHTPAQFDNAEVVDFVNKDTINPLVVGPPATDADAKVFSADGLNTVRQLTDASFFQSECQVILARMLDTVPAGVELTEPIVVYDVKPGAIQLGLSDDGKSLYFSGEIRVRTTDRPQSSIASVAIVYFDHSGAKQQSISTTVVGTASGYDDAFSFYSFTTEIDATAGIESFIVIITGTDGSTTSYDNNGEKYPVEDSVFVQRSACSVGTPDASGNIAVEIVACARGSASDVYLKTHLQTPRDVPFPLLSVAQSTCSKDSTSGGFTFYKGQFTINAQQVNSTTFDVGCNIGGNGYAVNFNRIAGIKGSQIGGNDNDNDDNDSGSSRPCGPSEACNAAPWATQSKWAVATPGIDQHTVPGGAGWTTPAATTAASTSTNGVKPVPKPTASTSGDQPAVQVYTGAASHDYVSSITLLSIIAALALAMASL